MLEAAIMHFFKKLPLVFLVTVLNFYSALFFLSRAYSSLIDIPKQALVKWYARPYFLIPLLFFLTIW
jgi:hypothetical protein